MSTLLFVSVSAILSVVALKRRLLPGLRQPNERARQPPGSTGLPLLWDMLRHISAYILPNPELFSHPQRNNGALFTTHLFGERAVFSADPSFNRLVLNGDGRIVESSYPTSVTTLLGAKSVLVTHGPAHKGLHSIALALVGFSVKPDLIADIDRLVVATMGQWEPGATVRLIDWAKEIAMSVNIKHLLSIEPAGPWSESIRGEFDTMSDGFDSVPFVGL